jgi:serine/threonine protein kinase/WD40 repeat protein/Flp pilus assembly protein TadD
MPADNSAIDPIDPVGPLADEFIARHRRGEGPSVSEYAERYPEHAARIKQLFPMLLAMEEAGGDASVSATLAPAPLGGEWAGPRLDRVGGYRLLREIGRGGMGIVYEAEQVALGRHVALKVLPLHAARDGSGLERFRLEARAAARLHHTNIVPVYEVGQDGDAYFYAMQYIVGQPLDQVLDEVRKLREASGGVDPRRDDGAAVAHSLLAGLPAPPPSGAAPTAPAPSVTLPGRAGATEDRSARRAYYRSVARVGAQVAQALDYAHKEGVIHRDVKPSNLLLDADGRVWVTDFGLAKTDGTALTQTGDIVGTVRYMAPERFNGWSDPRSDIYSLGLTLYEMLALRPAYDESEQMKLMQQVLNHDPAPLRRLDPQLPRDLETIIAKATDREPSRRYQTAAEFGADLQRFLDDRPILARRIGPGERAWRWARRNPALAAATALTFAALLIATVVSALFAAAQADAAAKSALFAAAQTDAAAKEKALSDELKKTLADSQKLAAERDVALKETRGHAANSAVHRAQSLMERGQLNEAMLWLARTLELAPDDAEDVRHFARASFASLEADAPRLTTMWEPRHPGPVAAAAFAADGTTVLTGGEAVDGTSEARLWDARTGEPRTPPLPHEGSVTLVAISPDGEALLTACGSHGGEWQLRLWGASTGRPLIDPVPYPGTPTALVCGPKGKTFFTLGTAKPEDAPEARFWAAADSTATSRVLAHAGPVTALAIGPKGDTVLTAWHSPASDEGGLRRWDARTGQADEAAAVSGVVTAATVAADGTAFVGTDSGTVALWHPGEAGFRQWLYESRGSVRGLALSPAGDLALVIAENVQTGRSEARLWDVHRGQWLGVALPHEAAPARAAFSPDGRLVLTWHARQPVRAWDVDPDRRWSAALAAPTPPGATFGWEVRYAPDGRSLLSVAASFQEVTARLWDAEAGTVRGRALHLGAAYSKIATSPDGRSFLIAGAREARVWDVTTGRPRPQSLAYAAAPWELVFSPDGATVALANARGVVLWDVAPDKVARVAGPPASRVADLHFDPDGKRLWVTTPAAVHCLDAVGGDAAPGLAVRGRGFRGAIPAPGGRLLAVFDNSGVSLWDRRDGTRADFAGPRSASRDEAAFTPDGAGLLTADPSGRGAQLWDVAFGKPVGQPLRCQSTITVASMRPDGRALAVRGASGVVRLFRRPEPAAGDAAALARQARALGGLELSAAGDVRPVGPADWHAAAAETPAGLPWHLRRGLDRVEAGQWGAAVWHIDRQLREHPDDWLALALRARALAELGRTDEAAADFDHSFEKGPAETVFAWHLLAALGAPPDDVAPPPAAKPRRDPLAAWFLDRLMARGGRDAAPLLAQRARGRERANRWDRAAPDYEHAARLAPDDAALLLEVSRAFAKHNQLDRAAEFFAQAAAAAPEDADVWLEAAHELTRMGHWGSAAKHYLRAIELQPDDPGIAAPRAATSLELARSPQVFDFAVKLRPNDPLLWSGRARYHVERGEWKEAADDFARAVELTDPNERSYELAAVLLVAGDEAGYRKAVARLVERAGGSDDPFLAYVLARACAVSPKSGIDPARAIAWGERAVAGQSNGWYLHALGLALYRKGDHEAALARLNESVKTDWVPVLNWLALALVHHRLGHADEARKYLDRATEFMDKRPPARPFTAAQLSTDVEEALLIRREADELIRGKKP